MSERTRTVVSVSPKMPTGIWRRGPSDWAYRVVVPGYGSIYGCGFASKAMAQNARRKAITDAEALAK